MTQGMVCHATFRDETGAWVLPADVEDGGGDALVLKSTGGPVSTGRSEKMSKSKKNVVDPEAIIEAYGADTARLFMLSDSPPDRDLDWTDSGVEGAWRYINRLWRMVTGPAFLPARPNTEQPPAFGEVSMAMHRMTHKTIHAVSIDLDKFHFNKAVARIRELTNEVDKLKDHEPGADWVLREGLEAIVRLIGPMMPHIAEELWKTLGHDSILAEMPWPTVNESLLEDDTVTIAVQVNGKLRGTLELVKDCDKVEAETQALQLETVASAMNGNPPRKVIVIPNRIVNIVV